MDIGPLREMLLTMAVLSPRMLAAFSVVPVLGGQSVQGIVKNSLVLSFALIMYPVVAPTLPADLSTLTILGIMAKEIAIGILFGFLAAIVFWAAESIGFVIDNQRGTTMASVVDPLSGSQTSPLGSLFQQAVIVLFFTSGGFLFLLGSLYESYRIWPVFSFMPRLEPAFALFFLQQVDQLMAIVVVLAAPVVIAVFVAEYGLGLINRFAPALNVFFLSMPIKSGVALFVIIVTISYLSHYFDADLINTKQINLMLQAIMHE